VQSKAYGDAIMRETNCPIYSIDQGDGQDDRGGTDKRSIPYRSQGSTLLEPSIYRTACFFGV
jgi:hypothetical protein